MPAITSDYTELNDTMI